MFFTQEDFRKIQRWLTHNSVKDTEFDAAILPLDGNEVISIIKDDKNKKIFLKDLLSQVFTLEISDFLNVSDKYDSSYISLEEAIKIIPHNVRKIGQVITFLNKEGYWQIYQFVGALNQWNILEQWKDLFDINRLALNSLLPDEEDITKSEPDENGNSIISLKDREYDLKTFSGYGKVILRKNIITIDECENKKNLIPDLDKENTIYEIRYDFDLNGEEIIVPENCILDFQGGSLSNGKIRFNNTLLYGSTISFKNVSLFGNLRNKDFKLEWFGGKADGVTDSTKAINTINNYIYNYYKENNRVVSTCTRRIILEPGTYIVSTFKLQSNLQLIGAGIYSTTIKTKSSNNYGVVTIQHNDSVISNLTIDGGEEENISNNGLYAYGNNGQNSTIHKVRFINCNKHSVVIEDTNMIHLDKCKFEDGKQGFVLLDGTDDVEVSYCTFETHKDFACPYALKIQTVKTVNKTANNAVVRGCWFEGHYNNTFNQTIIVNAYNANIHDNHFHTLPTSRKDCVCYVGKDTDMTKFSNNNIQTTGIREDGSKEFILRVEEGASYVYAANNRGLYDFSNTEILNDKFKIIYADGREYKSSYTHYTNNTPYKVNTTELLNDQWKAPFVINKMRMWYDANYVLRYKFEDPANNYDGYPVGTYVHQGYSNEYPVLTKTQRGFVFSEQGKLRTWNGTEYVRAEDGYPMSFPTNGTLDNRPDISTVENGYKYISNDRNYPALMISYNNKWISADGFDASYLRRGYSDARPICTDKDTGYCYFDRSLQKPIWWTGNNWVDASGNYVS